LGLACKNDWEIHQIDVKTAFLYGDLDKEIYMEPAPGMMHINGQVLLLKKVIYGLKQARRQWYAKLKEMLTKFDMKQIATDPNTYVAHKVVNGKPCILVLPVYVDDLLPIGDKELTDDFEKHIGTYFQVTLLGDASHFLGIRIIRDRQTRTLSIDQIKFADQIIEKFWNDNLPKSTPTPLLTSSALLPNEGEKNLPMIQVYQQVVGSIMYLMLGTRPDIAYAVGLLARFSSNPSEEHITHLGRLISFIRHTRKRYLNFQNDTENKLEGYTDTDYTGDHHNRKLTSGYIFFTQEAAFSWRSRLQDTVAASTMESEDIALYHASCNAVWIRNFYEQIGMALTEPLTIYCDNQPAIAVLKNEAAHKKAKHFEVKVHLVRDHVQS